MKTNERLWEPEEPFFATEQDFQNAVNQIYEEWRNRPKWEATTGFDEWKVAQLVQARARLDEVLSRASVVINEIDNPNYVWTDAQKELARYLKEMR